MDQKKWKEAETQVPTVAKVLEDVATAVGKVAEELEAWCRDCSDSSLVHHYIIIVRKVNYAFNEGCSSEK